MCHFSARHDVRLDVAKELEKIAFFRKKKNHKKHGHGGEGGRKLVRASGECVRNKDRFHVRSSTCATLRNFENIPTVPLVLGILVINLANIT